MTGADSFVAAGEAVPSIGEAALRIGLFLAVFAAVGIAWLLWQRRTRRGPRRIEIVDRALLSRGVSVALLRVESQRMLVGVSADGVRMLRSLPEDEQVDEAIEDEPEAAGFARILDGVVRAGGRQ